MRKYVLKPGQIGKYWPSKKPGRERDSDPWCLTWYDASARQTRRESLGTTDFQQACMKVAEHAILADKPQNAQPQQLSISTCLLAYWEEYAKHLASSPTIKLALRHWANYWGDMTVDQITQDEQDKFRKYIGEGRIKPSSVDKILSVGRAALSRAVNRGMLSSYPKINLIETEEDKRSRPPMGKPIAPQYTAKLLDAVKTRHLLVFIVIIANTLARNRAALDLRRAQFNPEENIVCLNPEGRRQNKKYRATMLVTPTLRRWLESETDPSAHYVTLRGKPLKCINGAWNKALRDAGLPTGFTPYSFRHGIAREMKRRRVPREQISLYLGHLEGGAARTTSIYAPLEPQDCTEAAEAIEAVMDEVRRFMKTSNLDNPAALLDGNERGRTSEGHLAEPRRRELEKLLKKGVPTDGICRAIGISNTTVQVHRRRLIALGKLPRPVRANCVPLKSAPAHKPLMTK